MTLRRPFRWLSSISALGIISLTAPALASDLADPAGCPTQPGTSEAGIIQTATDTATALNQLGRTSVTCPDRLMALRSDFLPAELPDLCATFERYQRALSTLRAEGIKDPTRIANVLAPRFINSPDWKSMGLDKGITSPYWVYRPRPQTWASWEQAAAIVDHDSAENFRIRKFQPVTLEKLLEIHRAGLKRLARAGDIRTTGEIGKSFNPGSTLPMSQIQALRNFEYHTTGSTLPMLRWVPTLCYADQPPGVRRELDTSAPLDASKILELDDPNRTFRTPDGVERQCGYIEYPDANGPGFFSSELGRYLSVINSEANGPDPTDPVLLAARAQRWFIGLHPFAGGNGRTSRLIMDEILQSEGLPTPTLRDMNDDEGTPETQWAREIGRGMLRTIRALEDCARSLTRPGCDEVSPEPGPPPAGVMPDPPRNP